MPIIRPSDGQVSPICESAGLGSGSSYSTVGDGAGRPSPSATRAQSRSSMFASAISWRSLIACS